MGESATANRRLDQLPLGNPRLWMLACATEAVPEDFHAVEHFLTPARTKGSSRNWGES